MPNDPRQSKVFWLSGKFFVPFLVVAILIGTAVSVYVFQISDHAFDGPTICRENLKELGRALFAYQDKHATFPPAFLTDEQQIPTHSWRTLLLPFLAQEDARKLALYYRFDKPWDAPENESAQSAFMPLAYKCPASVRPRDAFGYAHFIAIVGENTAWPETTTRSVDPNSRAVLLVEYAKDDLVWNRPKEILAADLLAADSNQTLADFGLASPTGDSPLVLYADGTVQRLPPGTTPRQLAEMAAIQPRKETQ